MRVNWPNCPFFHWVNRGRRLAEDWIELAGSLACKLLTEPFFTGEHRSEILSFSISFFFDSSLLKLTSIFFISEFHCLNRKTSMTSLYLPYSFNEEESDIPWTFPRRVNSFNRSPEPDPLFPDLIKRGKESSRAHSPLQLSVKQLHCLTLEFLSSPSLEFSFFFLLHGLPRLPPSLIGLRASLLETDEPDPLFLSLPFPV